MTSPPARTGPAQHLGFLDGVRALASAYVLIHHALLYHNLDLACTDPGPLYPLFEYGRQAVDVFFVLSGCVLMLPVARRGEVPGGLASYAYRRCKRILPPYYAAMIFSYIGLLVLPCPPWYLALAWPVTRADWAVHSVLLQAPSGWSYFKLNPIFWSVSFEWLLYGALPLVFVPVWRIFGVSGLLLGATALGLAPQFAPLQHLMAWPALMFLFGAAAAGIIAGSDRTGRVQASAFAACVATVLVGGAGDGRLDPIDVITGAVTMQVIVTLAAAADSPLRTLLESKFLARLAGFSYSLYLMHPPILAAAQMLAHRAGLTPRQIVWSNLLLGVPVCVFACYLFSLAFERPFLSPSARRAATPYSPPATPA